MNTEQTHLTVTRTIDAPSKDIFGVLTLPARHHEFDGSGFVRAADDTERITAAGEKFVMNMHGDRKSTRLNSSHQPQSRMPSSA